MVRGAAIAVLSAVLSARVAEAAQQDVVALVVRGPCPDEAMVAEAIAAVLPGTRIAREALPAPGANQVTVEDLGRRFRVVVGADRRELDDPLRDCGDRARSAAVLVALPLGLAMAERRDDVPAGTAAEPAAADPGLDAQPGVTGVRAEAVRRGRAVRVDLGLQVAGSSQPTTVDIGWGGTLRRRLSWGAVGAVLGVGGYSPQTLRLSSIAGEVQTRLLRFPIDLGFDLSHAFRRVELSGQLGVALVPFVASGENLADNRTSSGLDVGARVGGELRVPIARRLGLAVTLEVTLVPAPTTITVTGRGEVGRMPIAWLGTGLGFFWRAR